MPVLSKEEHKRLTSELKRRISALEYSFRTRELKSKGEGCSGRYKWGSPDKMCATTSSASELRMVVDDFKTILTEIKRLK